MREPFSDDERANILAELFGLAVLIGVLWVAFASMSWLATTVGIFDSPDVACDHYTPEEIERAEYAFVYTGDATDDSVLNANTTGGYLRLYENGSYQHSGPLPITENMTLVRHGPGLLVLNGTGSYAALDLHQGDVRVGPADVNESVYQDPRRSFALDRCTVDKKVRS